MNRNSEKVVTTVVLGVAALIGSLIAVALFGSEQPIRKVFSTAIIIDANTRLPIQGLLMRRYLWDLHLKREKS